MENHGTQTAPMAGGPSSNAVLEAVGSGWTRSLVEEVIGCLWLIAAVLAFGFKFDTLGWLLAIKAATDQGCAIWFSIKETIAEKKASNDQHEGPASASCAGHLDAVVGGLCDGADLDAK